MNLKKLAALSTLALAFVLGLVIFGGQRTQAAGPGTYQRQGTMPTIALHLPRRVKRFKLPLTKHRQEIPSTF